MASSRMTILPKTRPSRSMVNFQRDGLAEDQLGQRPEEDAAQHQQDDRDSQPDFPAPTHRDLLASRIRSPSTIRRAGAGRSPRNTLRCPPARPFFTGHENAVLDHTDPQKPRFR